MDLRKKITNEKKKVGKSFDGIKRIHTFAPAYENERLKMLLIRCLDEL